MGVSAYRCRPRPRVSSPVIAPLQVQGVRTSARATAEIPETFEDEDDDEYEDD
jgi:hypothetical protein